MEAIVMKTLKQIALILTLLISSNYASDELSIDIIVPNTKTAAEWERMYDKGNTVQTVGNILSFSGLGLSVAGIYSEKP